MNYRYRDKSELKQVESDWFALVPDNWNVLMFKRIVESVKNGNFIPEAQTDFIFAVAGEEVGDLIRFLVERFIELGAVDFKLAGFGIG